MKYQEISMKLETGQKVGRKSSLGFTVMELMIALSIGAILLTIGIPEYSAILHKNRIGAASSSLYTSLSVARGEAVKRRNGIWVCPSADSSSCRDDGDWSDGWLIYEDLNANNEPETSEIIRVVDEVDGDVKIEVSSSITQYLLFQPTGIAIGNNGNNGEFRICHDESNAFSRVLSVSAAGQSMLRQRTLTDCSEAG